MDAVTLILGGGGVKGIAHAGAWRALRERGVDVTAVVGTSIGALVGSLLARGMDWPELVERARRFTKDDIISVNRWALLFRGIRQPAVYRDERLREFIDLSLGGATWNDLVRPLSINAVDLATGETEWFGAGGRTDVPLEDAVYASCALPLFYPPAELDGRYYVDGGILDPLPVEFALARGADRLLAVDLVTYGEAEAKQAVEKGIVGIHHRVMEIMGHNWHRERVGAWDSPDLIHVRPEMKGYSTWDFGHTDFYLQEGYRATLEALERAGLGTEAKRARQA